MARDRDIKEAEKWHLNLDEVSDYSGCLSKVPGLELQEILERASDISRSSAEIVELTMQPEDCSLIQTDQNQILVTTDCSPLVGSNLIYAGKIAALNALSDVYACGGKPTWALVTIIAGRSQPHEYREAVLAGIYETCIEEEVQIVGGHTVYGQEAMAGLTVGGVLGDFGMIRKVGAQVGDGIFISKPVGTNIALRAYKTTIISEEELYEAIATMLLSNREASRVAVAARVTAMTDISGFGLLGHLSEMLTEELGAVLKVNEIPTLSVLSKISEHLATTNAAIENLAYARSRRLVVTEKSPFPYFLVDPQTNGSLLVTVPNDRSDLLLKNGFRQVGIINGTGVIKAI